MRAKLLTRTLKARRNIVRHVVNVHGKFVINPWFPMLRLYQRELATTDAGKAFYSEGILIAIRAGRCIAREIEA